MHTPSRNHSSARIAVAIVVGAMAATPVDASPRIEYGNIAGINIGTDACKPDDVYNGLKQARSWSAPVNLAVRGVTSRVPWRIEDNKNVGTHGYTRAVAGGVKRFHAGTDLLGDVGESVLAVASGNVIATGSVDDSIGKYVIIRTSFIVPPALPCAVDVLYAHLQSVKIKQNDQVNEGVEIGKIGRTGNLADNIPTHLHIELWVAPYRAGLDSRTKFTRDVMNVFRSPIVPGLAK